MKKTLLTFLCMSLAQFCLAQIKEYNPEAETECEVLDPDWRQNSSYYQGSFTSQGNGPIEYQMVDATIFYGIDHVQRPQRVERISACLGDTVHLLGQTITEDTMLVDTIPTGDLCDSLVYYHVAFYDLEFSVEPLVYCTDDTMLLKYGVEFLAIDSTRMDSIHFSTPIPIQNMERGIAESILNINSFENASTVSELGGVAEICVKLEHSFFNQLDLQVTAPNGREVFLNRHAFIISEFRLGEPIDNDLNALVPGIGYQYCWTMSALNTMIGHSYLYAESPLPAGSYLPEGSFDEFSSSPANGQWRLTASSLYESFNGHLFAWSIRFARPPAAGITRQGWSSVNGDLGLIRDSLSLSGNLPVGDYDFAYFLETQNGCAADTVLSVRFADHPPLPEGIDTFLCSPTYLFGQWIDVSGVYNFEFTPPDYCESTNTSLNVQIWDAVQADLIVSGEQNHYDFLVETYDDNEVLIDLGNGEIRQQREVSYTYANGGTIQPTATIYNPCDTLVLMFPELNIPPSFKASGRAESGSWTGEIAGIANTLLFAESTSFPFPPELTIDNGFFQHEKLWEFASFRLRPFKNDDPLNGLDIADVIQLSRHLSGSTLFSFPEQTLAADLNCDAVITNDDLLELQKFLLEPGKVFPDSCASWVFWPQHFALEDASNPFDHPVDIAIDSIQADTLGLDFYGVKRGDIGGNASAARGYSPPDSLFLRLKNGFAAANDTLQLDLRVENFEELVGFQVELRYDTAALDFQRVNLGEVPGMNTAHFGLSKVGEGIIRVVWLDILGNAYSLEDGSLAFGLSFGVKTDIVDRRDHIAIDARDLSAVSFNAELVEGPVALKVDLLTTLETSNSLAFTLLQNRPNPFNEKTLIPFELPKSSWASLRIYNQLGQLVWEKTARYPKGRGVEEVALSAPGLYYYQLETLWGQATRKMLYQR